MSTEIFLEYPQAVHQLLYGIWVHHLEVFKSTATDVFDEVLK